MQILGDNIGIYSSFHLRSCRNHVENSPQVSAACLAPSSRWKELQCAPLPSAGSVTYSNLNPTPKTLNSLHLDLQKVNREPPSNESLES